MVPNITVLFIFVTITSVTAQTFQYSRGWTNGKRDGRSDVTWANSRRDNRGDLSGWANGKRDRNDARESVNNFEKLLTPCQMNKLKYLLEGKALSESFFMPCDYIEDEDAHPRRPRSELHQTSANGDLFEAFQ